MRQVRRWIAASVLAGSAATGCSRDAPAAQAPEEGPTRAGETVGTGTLESEQEVALGFRVGGRLLHLLADQGDRVSEGQVVGMLAPDTVRSQLDLASAALDLTSAAVDRAAAEISQLQAALELATADRGRVRELAAGGIASRSQLDEAEARWLEAEARLRAGRAALREAERAVVQARRAAEVRQVDVADHELHSPVDGLILRRHQEVGAVVGAGAPVFTLVSTRKLWIRAWVDETALGALHEGQQARISLRSEPARSYRGRVDRIGHESDRETHELLVDVELLERPERLAIGQRADVFIVAGPAR